MANKRKRYSQAKKAAKKYPVLVAIIVAILVIAIIIFAVFYVKKIGPFRPEEVNSDGGGSQVASGELAEISSAELSVHFLELGNKYTGDCTLIKCGNTEVLIDAGSRADSAVTIKSYLDTYCTDGVLEYVIATHAHQDHIAGFVGNKSGDTRTGILYQYEVEKIIQFALTDATTEVYNNYKAAVAYAQERGADVYTARQCYDMTDGAQRRYYLDDDEKVSLNVLYNYFYYNPVSGVSGASKENDYSVCLMLCNETEEKTYNYLFTGDLEEKGEDFLVEHYKNSTEDFAGGLPQVELFKGGHHGSYTASGEKLLSAVRPKNVAVCCCCGTTEYTTNVANTFPAQAFLDRVAKYTDNIYCTTLITDYGKKDGFTSMNGNIVFYYKGGLKLYCSDNTVVLKDTDWFKANRVWNP